MSVSVNPPKTPVTKGSNGTAAATIPNVCKMPGPPAPFVPVPLPNIGKSGMSPKDYSQDVTIEGKAVAIKGSTFESMGDMASKGTGGGLISANTHGITKFVGPGSMDVNIEGKNVQFLSDPMLNNCGPGGSPPNSATVLGVMQMTGFVAAVEPTVCPLCGATDHEGLQETKATKADAWNLAVSYDRRRQAYRRGLRPEQDAHSDYTRSTMLGVVHCRDGKKKYAAQSGATTEFLRGAAGDRGMESPTGRGLTKNQMQGRMSALSGNEDAIGDVWASTEAYSQEFLSRENWPAGYPPGRCAAQQAVVLALDDGAIPVAMTERYHDVDEEGRTNKYGRTGLPIMFLQEGPGGARSLKLRHFRNGETVPPCRTCEAILPYLLCFDRERKCSH